ncbi:MAG: hypothetical protein PWP68_310, partial [Rikenellaceae bacterium]|nr:hypothetical protein [Rikenellaceae bacterium]
MKKFIKDFFYFLKQTRIKAYEWLFKINPKVLTLSYILISFFSFFGGLLTIFFVGNLYTPTVAQN